MPYDVAAARAQRLEAAGAKPWPFTWGPDAFELPAEPPADMLEVLAPLAEHLDALAQDPDAKAPAAAVMALPGVLDRLLGEDSARFQAHHPSLQDVLLLLTAYIAETFGGGLGESAASHGSSPGTAPTPKRTSRRTTGSTSRTTTARRAG